MFFIFAGNEDNHKASNEFEIWPDRTEDYGVGCHKVRLSYIMAHKLRLLYIKAHNV